MAKTYINLQTRWDHQKDRINDITNLIGDLALLTTGDTVGGDSDLVTAINELDSDIGARPHTNLTTTAKTLTGAINELDSDIGARLSLPTSDKSSLVNAIIELHDSIGEVVLNTAATTIKNAINEHETDIINLRNGDDIEDSAVRENSIRIVGTSEAESIIVSAGNGVHMKFSGFKAIGIYDSDGTLLNGTS